MAFGLLPRPACNHLEVYSARKENVQTRGSQTRGIQTRQVFCQYLAFALPLL